MSLAELIASVRERRRRSEQQSYEQGAQIMRRLHELLDVPTHTIEALSPNTGSVGQRALEIADKL